jgi:hypothetical protein
MVMDLDFSCQSQRYFGLDERELLAPMRELIKQCRSLIDVGANDGYYTLAFLRSRALRIVACEPGESVNRLISNAAANDYFPGRRFVIEQRPVGAQDGMVGIDEIVRDLPKPILLKIDIEGGEFEALKTCDGDDLSKLYWIIETHSRDLEAQCAQWLSDHGYEVRIIRNAFWRLMIPERRSADNRWLVATPSLSPRNDCV